MKEKKRIPKTKNIIKSISPEGFYTAEQVAGKTGRSIGTVYKRARKLGIPFINGQRYFTESDINAISKLDIKPIIPEGLYTIRQVAEITGRSIDTVYFWAWKLGIPHVNGRRYFTETQLNAKMEAIKKHIPPEGRYTSRQVAQKTGVRIETVNSWARKLGIPIEDGQRFFTEAQVLAITKAVKIPIPPEGSYTIEQVAQKTGRSIVTVNRRALKLGIPLVDGRRYFTKSEIIAIAKPDIKPITPEGSYTVKQVMEKTGRSIETVYLWARQLGIPFVNGQRYFTESQLLAKIEAIKKPIPPEGGYTVKQVAEITGREIRTVRKWAQNLGLPFVDGIRYFTESDIEKKMTRSPTIKRKDITGKKINDLTAIRFTGKTKKDFLGHDSAVWEWQCVCGNIIEKSINDIHTRHPKSCGCQNKKLMRERGLEISKLLKHFQGTVIDIITSKTINKNNTTGVRGVVYDKQLGKFRAAIGLRNRNIDLGSYKTLEEAKAAREAGEIKYYQPIIDEYNEINKQ